MTTKNLGLLVAGLTLALASPALGATVTVRVEGQSQVVAPTVVTTPATVVKDGTNACDGATALGALEAGTAGDWAGTWSAFGGVGTYAPQSVKGESHAFGSGGYWAVYVNGLFQNVGACQIPVHDGDKVLWFASDDTFTAGSGGYDEPVVLTAPATATPGTPFTVTVKDAVTTFDSVTFEGTTHFDPAAGATVTAGSATATTAADGTATLTLPAGGPVAIVATQGNRAPDRSSICVTDGSDGLCGSAAAPTSPAPACVTTGLDGRCGSPDKAAAYGFITGVANGRRFAAGKGPRELSGTVDEEPSGIADIRLRLSRSGHGPCAAYDAKRERFVATSRCSVTKAAWFSAGSLSPWRYLLPAKLGKGRYVLDVQVVDKAGNRDSRLARGRNRVVFTVA